MAASAAPDEQVAGEVLVPAVAVAPPAAETVAIAAASITAAAEAGEDFAPGEPAEAPAGAGAPAEEPGSDERGPPPAAETPAPDEAAAPDADPVPVAEAAPDAGAEAEQAPFAQEAPPEAPVPPVVQEALPEAPVLPGGPDAPSEEAEELPRAAMQGVFAVNARLADFVRGETQAAFAYWRALLDARSPSDLLTCHLSEVNRSLGAAIACWGDISRSAGWLLAPRAASWPPA
ncbi:MAG: hypothetical protein PGN34_00025 [Methylobacterium frigidaeris]